MKNKIIIDVLIAFFVILSGRITQAQMVRSSATLSLLKQNRSLIAFWDFSDTTGTPIAGSAKNVKLLPFNTPKFSAEGPLSGKSILLNGKTDYWYIKHEKSSTLDIKTNSVTVIAWVKWNGGTGFVAGKWNEYENGGKRQYGLFVSLPYYNGDSKVCGHISKNGGATSPFPYSIDYAASPQKVPLSTWVCIAFTYDGADIKSYFNGEFKASEPELIKNTKGFIKEKLEGLIQVKNPYHYPDGMGNNGSDFTIGGVQLKKGMGNFFKGEIGGIAIFNKALKAEEILKVSLSTKLNR